MFKKAGTFFVTGNFEYTDGIQSGKRYKIRQTMMILMIGGGRLPNPQAIAPRGKIKLLRGFRDFIGQCETEYCPFPGTGVNPDPAAKKLNISFADG
jgi:hypothetical protein